MNLTDNCPTCLAGPFEPSRVVEYPESIVGHYECPECGRKWWCSRLLSALRDAA